MRWVIALAGATFALFGCQSPPEQRPSQQPPAAVRTGPEVDLGAIARRTQLGFRSDGDAHVAASALLHVDARDDGALRLTAGAADLESAFTIRSLTLGSSRARVAEDGSLERIASELVEILELRDEGLEQSWRIASCPEGDLVVRVGVEDASYAGATSAGLHFRGDGPIGFRYGHGTLIDANGARTHVPAAWTGVAIELRVDASTLARSAFPAVLDPMITPEQDLDAPLQVPHVPASRPTALFDGARFWVAWYDSGRPAGSIRIARIAADGSVLDPHGIVVQSGGSDWIALALAGDRIFVAWAESAGGTYRARVKRVALDGTVLDAAPIELANASALFTVEAASDGTDVIVTYTADYSHPRAVRVSRDGVVLDVTPIVLPNFVGDVAFANGRYVMASARGTSILVWRVSSAGALLDATPISIAAPAGAGGVRLAESGAGIVMAWWEGSVTTSGLWTHTGIGACRLDDDGALGTSAPISFAGPIASRDGLDVSSSGAQTWISWAQSATVVSEHDVMGVRLSASGALVDATPVVLAAGAGPQRSPAIAIGPSATLVAWGHEAPSPNLVEGRRIDNDAAWIDAAPFPIAMSANDEWTPVSAYGAGVHLVAWTDLRDLVGRSYDVYAVRVSDAGAILDAAAFPIASTDRAEQVTDVVFDGTDFLVLYTHEDPATGTDAYARRVAPDGTLVDASPIVIAGAGGGQNDAHAAWDGTQHLVVWLDNGGGPWSTNSQVWAGRFARDGTALGTPTVLYAPYRASRVDAAFGAGVFVAGWYYRVPASTATANAGVRITSDGTVLDPSPLTLPGVEGIVLVEGPDSVLALGVWNVSSSLVDFYAGRIGASGAPTVTYTRRVSGGAGRWHSAAWTGTRYYAFAHERVGTASRLFGVPLDSGATLEPDGEFDVMAVNELIQTGSASSSRDGRALYVYSRNIAEAPYGADRVRARWVGGGLAAEGSACTDGNQCASGFCVDGVCCSSACGGGDPADCQACSVLAGGEADGTCAPRSAGAICRGARAECDSPEACDGASAACPTDALRGTDLICRAARGECDIDERCDGASDACPADGRLGADQLCRAARGDCDVEERCDGASDACPADVRRTLEHVCRAAAGDCDVEERCDGTADACPPDAVLPSDRVCRTAVGECDVGETCDGTGVWCPGDSKHGSELSCRPAAGACDVAEHCDGARDECPPDAFVADGTTCDDGLACNGVESCEDGACTAGPALDCDDRNPCTADACRDPEGCAHVPIAACGDAGLDAGPDAGTSPPPPTGCGCRVTSAPPVHFPVFVAALFFAVLVRRRR